MSTQLRILMAYVFVLLFPLEVTASSAVPVLVDSEWLEQRLNDPDIVLVDMSDETQYLRFHLPNAIHLPYSTLIKERKKDKVPVRLDDRQFFLVLGLMGISVDSHVVIYDDMGGLHAGRLFWELERVGHPRVSVLDGGLVKWVLEGRRVINKRVERESVAYQPRGGGRANEALLADVREASKDGSTLLLDVRTKEEYTGTPRQPRTGHVPRARLWSWDQAVDFSGGFTRKPVDVLKLSLDDAGVNDKGLAVIAYCRSGHRAAQTYLTLRSLGFENVKLYASSMNEYGRTRAPIQQGLRPCVAC